MTRVGVLGLGTMGGRVAQQLVRAGYEVSGFDPVEQAARSAAGGGVRVGEASEVVAEAGLVVLSLPRPEHVLAAAAGPLQGAGGALVVDLSTIDPQSARQAATVLAEADVVYLDAPVLGRPDKIGHWTLVAGGPEEAVARARQVLQGTVAKAVVGVGPVGSGSVVKLVNNLMFGAVNAVTAEALAICAGAGVEPRTFVEVVAGSGAATVSNLFRELAPKLVAGDYDPAFALDLLAKDNRLVLELARQAGVSAPVSELVDRINQQTLELGHGALDTGAVQEFYRRRPAGDGG